MTLVVGFALLFAQVSRVQVLDAEALRNNSDNSRSILRDFDQPRGQILTADRVVVATSEPVFGSTFEYQRRYPEGELYAHVTGYYSFNLGAAGVEKRYNDALSGRSSELRLSGINAFLGGAGEPGDVTLTIDHRLQRLAADALGDREGSIVMLEPATGAIVALYSAPSFDPNRLANHDGAAAETASLALNADPAQPRRPSAFADIYFPGSTFKVVTAASLLENASDDPLPTIEAQSEYYPPLVSTRPIRNSGGRQCGGTLVEMLAVSCNTGFARLAAEQLGPDRLVATAEAFGFNSVPPLDLDGAVASVFPTDYGAQLRPPDAEVPAGVYEDSAVLAQTALGQNNVSASPLMMALVAAAVANGGDIPTPHVVRDIRNQSGRVVERIEPGPWRRAIAPEVALELREAMRAAVETGTARGLAVRGLELAGKTGTAQLAENGTGSHAWVIGFAGDPGASPDVAFAVLVAADPDHPAQSGSATAVPIARDLVSRYFGLS